MSTHVYPPSFQVCDFFWLENKRNGCVIFFSVMIEFKNPPPPGNINFIKWWTIKKFNDVHMNWQGPTHLLVCLEESFGAAKHDKNGFNCIYLIHIIGKTQECWFLFDFCWGNFFNKNKFTETTGIPCLLHNLHYHR